MNKTPQILKGRLSTMYKPLEGVLSLSTKFYLLSFGLETLPENHLKSGWSILSTDRAHSNNNSNGS